MGSVPAPQTHETFAKVGELIAAPVSENELTAIAYEVAEIRTLPIASKSTPPEVHAALQVGEITSSKLSASREGA